ncbi:aldo/keto reductase [Ferrovibrio sp.]|uniref:aldo/keto reductase n=1 Tax=Ferrovibrio sp. TaxID=1917215 RepID=UPI00311F07EC
MPEQIFGNSGSLALGTAQLGLAYGVVNRLGQPDSLTADAILDASAAAGIRVLDTARDYGDAEARIGAWLSRRGHPPGQRPLIVTKTGRFPAGETVEAWLRRCLARSLEALGLQAVDALLLRSEDALQPGTGPALDRLKQEGLIRAAGLSVYEPAHLQAALQAWRPDAVQLTMNVFDTRFRDAGLLEECRRQGIAVFARSVYLQGLLVSEPGGIPDRLAAARPALAAFRALTDSLGLPPAGLAQSFVRDTPGITSLVLGAESVDQLKDTVRNAGWPPLTERAKEQLAEIVRLAPPWLADPRIWPQPAGGR